MVREVITLNVGGAGIRLGSTIWEQYNLEHKIDDEGNRMINNEDQLFRSFYQEIDTGQFTPRNLMIDLEPDAIEQLQSSTHAKLYNPDHSLCHTDGADGIWSRGYYTVGREMIDKINDKLRILADECDNVQGFIMNHSVGGGTGSGLGSLLLERLSVHYKKKRRFGFEIYLFGNNHSNNYVEAYNALLSTHWLLDHIHASFPFDNRKLYNLCKDKLSVYQPSYSDINSIITKIASGVTCLLRLEDRWDPLSMDMIFNNIVIDVSWGCALNRLKFVTTAVSPLINAHDTRKNKKVLVDGFVRENYCDNSATTTRRRLAIQNSSTAIVDMDINKDLVLRKDFKVPPPLYQDVMNIIYSIYDVSYVANKEVSVQDITESVAHPEYFSIDCPDFDAEEDKYICISMNYRGDVKPKEANRCIQWLKTNKKVTFWDGSGPTGFRVGLREQLPPMLSNDILADSKRSAIMMGNNTCISRFFEQRICKVFDRMYSQRAFVHWFVGDGMEEHNLCEAREDLGFLEKDYLDVLCEQLTDEADDDSD